MDLRISKRTALLLLLDIVATYVAYWLASVLTDVRGFVFVNNEIYFMLGILALDQRRGVLRSVPPVQQPMGICQHRRGAPDRASPMLLSTLGRCRVPVGHRREASHPGVYRRGHLAACSSWGGSAWLWRMQRRKKRAFSGSAVETAADARGRCGRDRLAHHRPHGCRRIPNMPGVPIVATDDDPSKQGLRIHGVKVAGSSDRHRLAGANASTSSRSSSPFLLPRRRRESASMPSAPRPIAASRRCRTYANCAWTNSSGVALRDVEVTDLLGREEIMLDTRIASSYIAGKAILVTGGGGSIGSELCRQLAKVAPERIVIFDMYENDAYMLRQELMAEYRPHRSGHRDRQRVRCGAHKRGVREVSPFCRLPRCGAQARPA